MHIGATKVGLIRLSLVGPELDVLYRWKSQLPPTVAMPGLAESANASAMPAASLAYSRKPPPSPISMMSPAAPDDGDVDLRWTHRLTKPSLFVS
jgi:hypothetical protein